jgi:membrane-associated phospholipid phosphatase
MIPLRLLGQIVVVVGLLVGLALVGIVRPHRLQRVHGHLGERLVSIYPYVGALGLVLGLNTVARDYGQELSWLLDWNITGVIYSIEGSLVADLQNAATPALTALLSNIYIYGYVFLLVFPLLAYLALDDMWALRETLLAYGLNYAIGMLFYILFVSYGPRNLMPDMVDPLMYANWPQSQLLVSEVNSNTNVFPSLHSSLSATVVLLAYRTRETYFEWFLLSIPLAVLVIVSTMYLGIHWGTDVVAGIALAALSVGLAVSLTDEQGQNDRLDRTARRAVGTAAYPVRLLREWLSDEQSL